MPSQSEEQQKTSSSSNAHYMRVTLAIFIPVVALAIALPLLWSVSQQSGTGSEDCVLSADEIALLADAIGYKTTGDEVTSVLLSILDDVGSLEDIALICVNDTQSAAKLLEINPAAYVTLDGDAQSLASYYADGGSERLAYALAHTGIVSVNHTVEMNTSSWDIVRSAVEGGSESLAVDVTSLLEGIKENDMSVRTIREVLSRATEYGFSAASIVQIPEIQATDANGTTYSVLNQTQIGIAAGTIQ